LEEVFHEYSHLLLRHNEPFWPIWLKEGMADIYATFQVTGEHTVQIGQPMEDYLRLLAQRPLLPLRQLFGVARDSPEYNERERQGIFYAESWLLTHYLMAGDNPRHRVRFGDLTRLLQQGQPAEQAFTNAFQTTLLAMEQELRGYLSRGKFGGLTLAVQANLRAPQPLATRGLTPVERCCRLGDALFRVGRLEEAEAYFLEGQRLAPRSPLPLEGLGLLAAQRHDHALAASYLQQALQFGSTSFLTHYGYAREQFRLATRAPDAYSTVEKARATEIRAELEKALAEMPDFGPAHRLLGILELVQGQEFATAAQHLQRAIQLEPEDQSGLLTLAQAQMLNQDPQGARRTLEPLLRPYVQVEIQRQAKQMLMAIGNQQKSPNLPTQNAGSDAR
jgi:tetratricopeptide (TPR) repeat protein